VRRLFRELFRAGYWIGAIGLAISVSISVTRSGCQRPAVAGDQQVAANTTPVSDEGRRCQRALRELYGELTQKARVAFVGEGGPRPGFFEEWRTWSRGWRDELDIVRSRCRLTTSEAMRPMRRLADQHERLHLAYTTALRGFTDVGRRELIEIRDTFGELPPLESR